MSSRRYRVDQEIEICNFRVVPDLPISKKVEFVTIYMIIYVFVFRNLFFCLFALAGVCVRLFFRK